jgi:hypothetical protein
VNPKQWQSTRKTGATAAAVDALIKSNMGLPEWAGMSEDTVRKHVEEWLANDVMHFGGDFAKYAQEGKTRMSQSLFTKRKQLRPEVQAVLGKVHDPIEREVLSIAKLVKSSTTAKAVADILKVPDSSGQKFAMPAKEWEAEVGRATAAGDTARADFLRQYELVPDSLKGLGVFSAQGGERVMAQRQVMDMLQAGVPHGNIDWEKGFLGFFSRINKIPKAAFTLYNPGTHIHNVVQAPLQAAAAGMAPWSFVNNIRRLHADPKKLRWAKEDGIMDAHMGAGEFRRAADSFETILNPPKLGFVGKLHEAVKRVYGKPDQWARGASYMKFLDEAEKRGVATAEARRYAVEMTNRYTQNYSNVAPAVAIARNIPGINPFISYTAEMARIIKNLAEDVAFNANGRRIPSAVALASLFGLGAGLKVMTEKLMMSDEEKQKIDGLIPILPDYMRGRTQAGVGFNDRTQTGKLVNLQPWLPAEDFVQMARNIATGDWDALKSTNPVLGVNRSPGLNLYNELTTGKDPVTGAPSEGPVSAVRKQMLPSWLPGGYQAKRLLQGFTQNAEGGRGITDDRGREETPGTALAGLAGVSVAQMNRPRLMKAQEQRNIEQARQAKTRLNRILRSNTNAEEKEAAAQTYQEERRRIFQRR